MWAWGPMEEEKKRLGPLLQGIAALKERGIGVAGTFHARELAPLGARAKPMFEGAPGAGSPVPTQMTPFPDAEVVRRLRKVLNAPRAAWPLGDQPVALPDTRAVVLVSARPSARHLPLFFTFLMRFFAICLSSSLSS